MDALKKWIVKISFRNFISSNKEFLIVSILINAFILFNFIKNDRLLHGIGYFIFFYVAMGIIKVSTISLFGAKEPEIKNPKKELLIAILFTTIGFIVICIHFYIRNTITDASAMLKLPVLLLVVLFAMPLGLLVYLLLNKYSLVELGLRFKPLKIILLGISICLLTGLFAYFFNPEGILWKKVYEEYGLMQLVLTGLFSAAWPEEFSRFIMQSRLNANGLKINFSILLATAIWALMHFPVAYYQTHDWMDTIYYCIQIIPLGIIWGYLTYRTRSILPAVIAHGFNLWGFQNG